MVNTGPFYVTGSRPEISIRGVSRWSGGGTFNFEGAYEEIVIVVDGDESSGVSNKLVNVNQTIFGTAFIGGKPDGVGGFTNGLEFVNQGIVEAREGDIMFLIGENAPVRNEGLISIAGIHEQFSGGSVMKVIGEFQQTSTGRLALEFGGGVPNALYDPESYQRVLKLGGYSHLDVTGEVTLDGALKISLTNNFSPQLGDTFTVLNFGSRTAGSDFFEYSGLRLANGIVLRPTFTDHALVLTASVIDPGTTAPLQPIAPGGSAPVPAGQAYAGTHFLRACRPGLQCDHGDGFGRRGQWTGQRDD